MSRTATVRLADGTTVSVSEPDWCTGQHEDDLDLVDLSHDGADTVFLVDTERGPAQLFHAVVTQAPYSTHVEEHRTNVAVHLDNDYYRFRDVAALYTLADQIAEHAVQLRQLARHLDEIHHHGQ
ncbi:DUF6907 domain-containing protein [Kitasatospora aureofaciens]|uniref:DUF6907 domain-containing protein n=1 Tax=Kitasatospora aureofaciens TaxID=1894 RepID=UPI003812C4BD